jgi:hypothetical protein
MTWIPSSLAFSELGKAGFPCPIPAQARALSASSQMSSVQCVSTPPPVFHAYHLLVRIPTGVGPGKEEEAIGAYLKASNWRFDNSQPELPGIKPLGGGKQFSSQKLGTNTHPHLRLDRENTMISVPRVNPGDMVFWHCASGELVQNCPVIRQVDNGLLRRRPFRRNVS